MNPASRVELRQESFRNETQYPRRFRLYNRNNNSRNDGFVECGALEGSGSSRTRKQKNSHEEPIMNVYLISALIAGCGVGLLGLLFLTKRN